MKKHFAIIAIYLLTLLSCSSEKTSSVSSDTAEADTSYVSEVQEPIVDSITTSIPDTGNVPQSNQKSITYYGKYTLGEDQTWYSDNFSLEIVSDQIIYKKDGSTKNFNIENQGVYTRKDNGIEFKYQKYYLPSKRIYMLISHTKEIKHHDVFYYRIIIDGQTQLAL